MKRIWRFRTRILVWFVLIVMLPMTVLSVYLYEDIVRSAEQRLTQQLNQASGRWVAGYRERTAQIEALARMLVSNSTITNYINARRFDSRSLIRTVVYSFRPLLEWLMSTNTYLFRIHFFTANTLLPEDRNVTHANRYTGEAWYQDMVNHADGGRLLPADLALKLPYDMDRAPPMVCAYQLRMPGAPSAFMQLDVRADWLYDDVSLALDSATGQVRYSTVDKALEDQTLTLSSLPSDETDGQMQVDLLGQSYYASAYCADGMRFINLIPTQEMMGQLRDAQRSYLISCLVLAALMLGMVYVLAWYVTRRVETIGGMVSQIARGEYRVHYTPQYDDEIDRLGADVQNMGEEMDRLVNQGLRQVLLTRETEFRALQAQINPHFIFNTLESFRMLAELNGLKNLSDMMALLGKLMRYNLGGTADVSLDMELENVADYIAVQNLNLNDRIILETRLDDSTRAERVLRLMLQPLVENAIVHGMPPKGTLHIGIDVAQTADRLNFRIYNDGRPMSPEETERLDELLSEARRNPVQPHAKSIALQNIQRRLILQYGPECRITIVSNPQVHFCVEWSIPTERRNESCV